MKTAEGEPGLFAVIEGLPIDGPEIRVASLMLGVADGAVGDARFPVDALFGSDPFADPIVAHETAVAVDVEVGVVAVFAAVGVFKTLVGETEVPGHETDFIFLGERRDRKNAEKEEQEDGRASPRSSSDEVKIRAVAAGSSVRRRGVCGARG